MQLNTDDPTLPVVETGRAGNATLYGAVVIINISSIDGSVQFSTWQAPAVSRIL